MKKDKTASGEKRATSHFVSSKEKTVYLSNSESIYDKTPVWSFSCCDFEHKSWGIFSDFSCVEKLFKRLKDFEGQTWGEIFRDTSGRKGNTKNHLIAVDRIDKNAMSRLQDINLDTYDELVSLTITGKMRLFGVISENIFLVIWFDRKHEICKSKKKHT